MCDSENFLLYSDAMRVDHGLPWEWMISLAETGTVLS